MLESTVKRFWEHPSNSETGDIRLPKEWTQVFDTKWLYKIICKLLIDDNLLIGQWWIPRFILIEIKVIYLDWILKLSNMLIFCPHKDLSKDEIKFKSKWRTLFFKAHIESIIVLTDFYKMLQTNPNQAVLFWFYKKTSIFNENAFFNF